MIRCVSWSVATAYARRRAQETGRRHVVVKAAPYYMGETFVPSTWVVTEREEPPRHRRPVIAR